MKRLAALIVSTLLSVGQISSYSFAPSDNICRRRALSKLCSPFIVSTSAVSLPFGSVASAKEQLPNDSDVLIEATEALSSLLDNWEKATVDCTYADVPRELLEAKNKEKLLEKASEFALFDKSTSVVSCKRTNRIVSTLVLLEKDIWFLPKKDCCGKMLLKWLIQIQ